jgi:hypothetical protein
MWPKIPSAKPVDDEEDAKKHSRQNDKAALPTKFEIFIVHMPFGLSLGYLSYMTYIIIAHSLIAAEWHFWGWSDVGMTWVFALVLTLIIAAGSMLRADPSLAAGFLWGIIATIVNNTSGTCDWDASAGIAIRMMRGQHLYWNVTTEAACKSSVEAAGLTVWTDTEPNANYRWYDGKCRRIFSEVVDGVLEYADRPYKCQLLGTRNGIVKYTKGYHYLDGTCLEDPGTCPYQPAQANIYSHTPEYIISTTFIILAIILVFVVLGSSGLRFLQWKKLKQKDKIWKEIMDPTRF